MSYFAEYLAAFGADAVRRSVLYDNGEAHLCGIMESRVIPEIQGERIGILEIGTCRGISASILARYGHVYTFDVKAWKGFDETIEFGRAYAGRNGIHFHGVTRMGIQTPEQIAEIAQGFTFHVAHEDASHRYPDIAANWPVLSRCGRVIFHDYDGSQPDVTRFVNECRLTGHVTRSGPFAYWRGTPKVERRDPDTVPRFHLERAAP